MLYSPNGDLGGAKEPEGGAISSKKVPALTQGFEWAYVPGVGLYLALEQSKRQFLPRITHKIVRCAPFAN
jgi:hypothetical protein